MREIPKSLADGYRMEKPSNDACNEEMYGHNKLGLRVQMLAKDILNTFLLLLKVLLHASVLVRGA